MELTNQTKIYKEAGNLSYSCQYHVLFCSKFRRKVLSGEIAERLKQLIKEKQSDFGYELVSLDVTLDHVHMIVNISPELKVYGVISKIKACTSHELRSTYAELRSRIPTLWTRVCMISSVGNVSLNDIESFLEAQKKR